MIETLTTVIKDRADKLTSERSIMTLLGIGCILFIAWTAHGSDRYTPTDIMHLDMVCMFCVVMLTAMFVHSKTIRPSGPAPTGGTTLAPVVAEGEG